MISLKQALLDRTELTAEDLAMAESRRAEMGGRLETALLELGLITETELAPALATHYNLPAATVAQLQNIPDSVQALISAEHAGGYLVVPFAAAPGRIDVAVGAALDLEQADELAFLLGRRVRFFVLNEVRVAQALQRYYRRPQPARLLNLADRLERGLGRSRDLASDPEASENSKNAGGDGGFGAFGPGARRPVPKPGMAGSRRLTPTKPREERRSVALSDKERQAIFGPPRVETTAAAPEPQVPASDLARLSHRLQGAASPTAVGEAFLAYLGSFFDSVVLLRPEGQLFCGWLALGAGLERDELRELMTGPALAEEWRNLAGEQETVDYRLGPSTAAIELDSALAVEAESAVSLVPVRVQDRIVCLAVCAPGRPLTRNEGELLGNASVRTGLALQSWILRQKTLPNEAS